MTARDPRRVRTVDIHAHWYPADWLRLFERDGTARGRGTEALRQGLCASHRAAHERVHRGVRRPRPAARGDGQGGGRRPRAVAHDADGLLGIARPRARARAVVQRRRFGRARAAPDALRRSRDAADAGAGARAEGARARVEAPRHARHVPRHERQRRRTRRQAVLGRLRKGGGARLAGVPASGRHDRARPDRQLLPAEPARQSLRHRRRRRVAHLRRRARRLPSAGSEPAARGRRVPGADRPARPRHQGQARAEAHAAAPERVPAPVHLRHHRPRRPDQPQPRRASSAPTAWCSAATTASTWGSRIRLAR